MNRFVFCLLLLFAALPAVVRGELTSAEVGVIAIKSSENSVNVARHYMQARNIPASQVLLLDLDPAEEISREVWEKQLRPAIRRWLAADERVRKLRCLVTVWDVPLRIGKGTPDLETRRIMAFMEAERKARIERLNQNLKQLSLLAGGDGTAFTPLDEKAGIDDIQLKLNEALGPTQSRVQQLSDEAQKQAAMSALRMAYFRMVGLTAMATSLQGQLNTAGTATPEVRSEYDVTRGRTVGLREGRSAMEAISFSIERENQILALIQLSDGLFGTIAWIDEVLRLFESNESHSSFDSELSLVAWPDYQLVRWQPNYLHYRFDGAPIRDFRKTFMVSRLEAPSIELTLGLIDRAVEVEKTGLQGKVYLDARGVKQEGGGSSEHYEFDQSLVRTGELLRNHSNLEVVVDQTQELFQPGSATDVAFYSGWYSLAKYVDAFDWNPGSIGFHMASGEASTLRRADSEVWCKRMLEDGVAATFGPCFEPYLSAFHRPDEFASVLFSGKYTLAECYYRTKPFNSWTMLLVGDPLYSPYRNNPPLQLDNVDVRVKRIVDGPDVDYELPTVDAAAAPAEPAAN